MSAVHPSIVEVETQFHLINSFGPTSVDARLRYDPTDPYAVWIIFPAESAAYGEEVAWAFGRELLIIGLEAPAGLGDVEVWPYGILYRNIIALELSSPEGHNLFHVPRRPLMIFLHRTLAEVPLGRETEHLNLDPVIRQLLADE